MGHAQIALLYVFNSNFSDELPRLLLIDIRVPPGFHRIFKLLVNQSNDELGFSISEQRNQFERVLKRMQ